MSTVAHPVHARHTDTARAAGLVYLAAWLVGLVVATGAPGIDATPAARIDFVTAHRAATLVQSLLVHGVAAVALAIVVTSARRSGHIGTVAARAGLLAAGLSVVQCVLGITRSLAAGSTIDRTIDVIDRLDGVKMFALAVLLIAGSLDGWRRARLGRVLLAVGLVGGAAALVAGIGYVVEAAAPAALAFVALPLLLVWVVGLGWAVGGER